MSLRHTILLLTAFIMLLPPVAPAGATSQHSVQMNTGNLAKLERLLGAQVRGFNRLTRTTSLPVILVTKTDDSGPGSLRQALLDANSHIGGDSIVFNVPTTDPGYDKLKGVWTIKPLTQFPPLNEDGTVIDGHSQKLFSPGSNPSGPAVELDGSLMTPIDICLLISCSWTFVRELTINRFETGIVIAGANHSFNLIYQCYIGVTPDGKSKAPNLNSGILITGATLNFISWPDTTFTSYANVIGGNGGAGIEIMGTASTLNYVGPNCIGTDLSRTADLGNAGDGILINDGACEKAVMNFDAPQYIVIRNNGQAGIRVSGGETLRNLLAAGSITNNGGPGILLEKGGNSLMASPIITSAVDNAITATATPMSLVAFYRDPEDEGEEYLGQAYADAAGNVTYHGPLRGPYLTAIAIDTTTGGSKNNTSAFSQPCYYQAEILVTNTNDDGRGSYRAAVISANSNPGLDIIKFAIPQNDPGFNAQLGIWTIKPTMPIPAFMDEPVIIAGSSQKDYAGYDVNPFGPEIELDGSLLTSGSGVFLNHANGSTIEGLVINGFNQTGITIYGTDTAQVVGCYVGTDARGLQSAPNDYGIVIANHARNVIIQSDQAGVGNLISGNIHHGIQVSDSCSTNHIVGNTIGLDRTRTKKLGNGGAGIDVNMGSDGTEIANNWIGGNWHGIDLLIGCHSNVVMGNMLGTDTTCRADLGNAELGILVSESRKTLIRDNRIAYNGENAVVISGASALSNRISRNSICHHGPPAIINYDGGNAEHPRPTITGFSAGVLTGTALANDFIEAFSDSSDEGESFLGYTTAGADGRWALTQLWPLRGRFITATATDANGNTSCLSAPFDNVAVDVPAARDEVPRSYALSQNYPNPFNPSTRIKYTVGGTGISGLGTSNTGAGSQGPGAREDGTGGSGLGARNTRLVVYDLLGREVVVLVNEMKQPGYYEVSFDASNLASGMYICRMTAGNFIAVKSMLLLK
jgi:hypothetical protein